MGFPQNAWPNFENFPSPSFPQEVDPPNIDPDEGDMICVTYSRQWAAVLLSACGQLTQLSTWKGDDEAKKLAANRATNLAILLQTDIGCNDMGCCYDVVEKRVTPDGTLEIRINGGDWIPDPNDPRSTAVLLPPITMDANHTKCDAATNVNEHFNDLISGMSEQLGGGGSVVEICIAVVALIFAVFIAPELLPALVPAVMGLIAGLLFLGQAAWDAYFSSDVHDKILCAIYCTIGSDGTFTDSQYAALLSRLNSTLPTNVARTYFVDLISRIGLVGINDYAAIGASADADCSSCGCDDLCADFSSIVTGFGVENSRSGGNIINVTAAVDGSHWSVRFDWPSADSCCRPQWATSAPLEAGLLSYQWIDCGQPIDGDWTDITPFAPDGTHPMNKFLIVGSAPWTADVKFNA